MLELKNAIITQDKKKSSPYNLAFDKGLINYLSYSERDVFNFLNSKEKYLEDGSFVIDGVSFIPYDEASEKTLLFIAINSQNIALTACFVADKKEKKEVFERIQGRLVALKDLPLITESDKFRKISFILDALYIENVNFLLVDENNETFAGNLILIDRILPQFAAKIPVIYLKKEEVVIQPVVETVEEVEEDVFDDSDFFELCIGVEATPKAPKAKKPTKKVTKKDSVVSSGKDGYLLFNYKLKQKETPATRVLNYLARNIIVLLFLTISLAGFSLTLLLSAQYFNLTNSMLGIMFIALSVVFLGLYVYNIYSCFDFIKTDTGDIYKRKFLYTTISNTIIVILGVLLSIGLYNIFVSTTEDFVLEVNNNVQIIVIIVGVIFILVLPAFIKQIYRLFKFLSKKLSED